MPQEDREWRLQCAIEQLEEAACYAANSLGGYVDAWELLAKAAAH